MKSIRFLKNISNNTKLRLISLLLENELCVCELEEILHIRQANISKNLISLKDAGIVNVRREKQRGFYSLTTDFLSSQHLIEYIKEQIKTEEILQNDYQEFLNHEDTKDNNVYVCSAYRKEVKQ
jgi:ArsR family transcriptional regulator